MTTHTRDEIRDNRCNHCKYEFGKNYTFNGHEKTVHDKIRNHSCNQCEYLVQLISPGSFTMRLETISVINAIETRSATGRRFITR